MIGLMDPRIAKEQRHMGERSCGCMNNESEEVFLDSIEFTYATFSSSSLITSTTSGLNEESASSSSSS